MPESSILAIGLGVGGRNINISCLAVKIEKGKQVVPAANDK